MSTQATTSHAGVSNLPASVQGPDLQKAPLKPLESCLDEQCINESKIQFDLHRTGFEDDPSVASPTLDFFLSEASLNQGPASSIGLVDLSLGPTTNKEGKDQVGLCHKPGKDSKEIEKSVHGNEGRDDGPCEGARLQC
jgi:hypothetical protein